MSSDRQTYHVKVDSSGRIVLPADARARNHIAEGDTVIVVEDGNGFHVKTRDQIVAEAQAYFASFVPAGVMLSDEILADRRSESERD